MACDRRTARLACVDLPAFPLQLQLREQPQWHQYPCAVIDQDKPQGTLLWVNERARQQRILPGMRYAAALALTRDLRAAEVSPDRIQQAVERLTAEVLTTFSPRIEASEDEPGVFWLDLSGMERLFPDLESWAGTLSRRLGEEGFVSRVVVGWSRFYTYALAKSRPPIQWSVVSDQLSVVSCRLSDPTHPDVAETASENVGAGVYPPPAPGGAQACPERSRRGPSPTSREPTPVDTSRGDLGEQGWTTGDVSAPPHNPRRDDGDGRGLAGSGDPGASPQGHGKVVGGGQWSGPRWRGGEPGPTKSEWGEPLPGRPDLRVLISRSPDHERQQASRVPLHRLGLDPAVREALDDLGITTLGEFANLPHEGIERRFGRETAQLHQQACGQRQPPLEAEEITVEIGERVFLEQSVRDLQRLLVWLEALLAASLGTLGQRGELAAVLLLELSLENGRVVQERLQTAEPTNDLKQWLELLRLRLEDVRLSEGAQEISIVIIGKRVPAGQMDLFAVRPRRDLAAANRALARVRAEMGDAAIRLAEIRDGHLPEARFAWRPFENLEEARAARIATARLVRRLFARPKRLPPRPRQEPDGWLLRGLTDCPVDKVRGPFVVAGGWWRRPVHREYHYAETRKGEVLWTYYDRYRRRWFLQGRIE